MKTPPSFRLVLVVLAFGAFVGSADAEPASFTGLERKCEATSSKALSAFVAGEAACVRACLKSERKQSHAYGGCFPPAGIAIADCLDGPKGAAAKARAAVAKACTDAPGKDRCPDCYATSTCTTGDPLVAQLASQLAGLAADLHCLESGSRTPAASVQPVTPTKAEAKCEDGLAKALGKLVATKAKCHVACNQKVFKGTIAAAACRPPVPSDPATAACLARATEKATAAIDSACFTGHAVHPSCYDGSAARPATAAAWAERADGALGPSTAAATCLVGCGNGSVDAGELCDPPGSTGQCAGGATCTDSCGCPTLLTDSAGAETTEIQSQGSVAGTIAGLLPYAQYDLRVLGGGNAEVAKLRLTADGSGTIPLTILAYNLPSGSYVVEVRGVSTATGDTDLPFTATEQPGRAQAVPTDAAGVLRTTYQVGEDVYVRARNLTPGTEVDLYVVTDQAAWADGDPLIDRSGTVPASVPDPSLPRARDVVEFSGTAETVTVGPDGTITPHLVWADVEGVGAAFDVVVDVDRDGLFGSATDAVTDHLTTGFVIQAVSGAALGRAASQDFVTNLSYDRSCRPRDRFTPADDVRVLVNPPIRMQLGGDHYVKKYIVAHKATWAAGDPLVDVSGANSPWDADTVQSGCTNEGCVLTWPAPLDAGDYDVVIDVNRNDHYDPGVDVLDGGTCPGFTVSATVPPRKDWTVMVYMDGDNNLEPEAIKDLNEMERVGSTDRVNVVVQIDRIPGGDASNGDWTDTRRYFVTKDTQPSTITSQQQQCPTGELNMADPLVLQDFVSWAAASYPADHYALVIWNHGRGFRLRDERMSRITRDIAWDDTNGGSLDMPEVERAIAGSGVHLSLLGYDACLMGMAEVAQQTSTLADVTAFSQDVEPGEGWPYDDILAALVATPGMDAAALGRVVVQRYGARFPTTHGITYSSVASSALGQITAAMDDFARAMLAGIDVAGPAIRTARSAAQAFKGGDPNYDDYRDLVDFAARVEAGVGGADPASAAIRTAAADVRAAVTANVDAETHSSDVPEAHGITAWLPDCAFFNNYVRKYGDLRFARGTQWDEFLSGLCGQLLRVELSWGASPSDLDSHLWDTSDPPNHLYYRDKEIPSADLDLDDTTGFGPENVRVRAVAGPRGHYDYAVHHYAGVLPPSAPVLVRVFRGSATVPIASFTRSDWPIVHGYWHVFQFVPGAQTVIPIDTMSAAPPVTSRARDRDDAPAKDATAK